jgi:hypothetical protein
LGSRVKAEGETKLVVSAASEVGSILKRHVDGIIAVTFNYG